MSDLISRQAAIDALDVLCQEHRYRIPGKRETYSQYNEAWQDALDRAENAIGNLPSAQPEPSQVARDIATIIENEQDMRVIARNDIVRCKDCKHNPKDEWFGCPMSHLNEKQRPETAWCWKGERKDGDHEK